MSDVIGKAFVKACGHVVAGLWSFKLSALILGETGAYAEIWRKIEIRGYESVSGVKGNEKDN